MNPSSPAPIASAPQEKPSDLLQFTESSFAVDDHPDHIELDTTALLAPDAADSSGAASSSAAAAPSTAANVTSPAAKDANAKFYQVAYYQPYFNVDSKDVLYRLFFSICPYNSSFLVRIGETADLYGPIWLSTTLIFFMGVTANFASYLNHRQHPDNSEAWAYDFSRVTIACAVIYLYLVIVPVLVWLIMRYNSVPCRWVEVACVYGYAYTAFLLASLLCIAPSDAFRWFTVLAALLLSFTFIFMSLRAFTSQYMPSRAVWLYGFAFVMHLGLALIFKFVFFEYQYVDMDV
jgi:hypothetical protein